MTHPLILPDSTDPHLTAADKCRAMAERLRAIGREDLALRMEQNAAAIIERKS